MFEGAVGAGLARASIVVAYLSLTLDPSSEPKLWLRRPELLLCARSLQCSSFLGLPFRILNVYLVKPKKQLQWRP